MDPLSAQPLHAHAVWTVHLPVARPVRLYRSLDGGSTVEHVATLSEAWTASTFADLEVPATAFPLYTFELGEE